MNNNRYSTNNVTSLQREVISDMLMNFSKPPPKKKREILITILDNKGNEFLPN